jgi:putative transcriptional regulator
MVSRPTYKLENCLCEKRRERGWSQHKLADLARISRSNVSAIEIGRLAPSIAIALRLAAVFECSVEDLFVLSESGSRKTAIRQKST